MSLAIGIPTLVSGAGMALYPRRKRLAAMIRDAARTAELGDGAPERFFEERRTLEAYPPAETYRSWRRNGLFLVACGGAPILLAIFR